MASHCKSLDDRVPVDEIYWYPIFIRVENKWYGKSQLDQIMAYRETWLIHMCWENIPFMMQTSI